ncbi:hypothetical protein RDABS01_032145 [Bienertia sinuspersici]
MSGKVALLPIPLGTVDFLVHHIHAFTIHVMKILDFASLLMSPIEGNMPSNSVGSCILRSVVWGSTSDHGVVSHSLKENLCKVLLLLMGGSTISYRHKHPSGRAHNKLKFAPNTHPRALSIVQGRTVGVTHYILGGIATTWAFFLARIIADPTTHCIWFRIANAHDFESHDDFTEERLYRNIFASHFGQLATILVWTSEIFFHVAWQGNVESWVQDPLHLLLAGGGGVALRPVNNAYSGFYQWWYTIGLHTNEDLYIGALFSIISFYYIFTSGLVISTIEMETECFVVQKCGILSKPSLVRTLRSKFFGLGMAFS